ncbi:MAG: hypothetical protein JSR26_12310 [Proteobacteria bacterium]|nr:hypothetical protein [Pseudomonadota bacterium]
MRTPYSSRHAAQIGAALSVACATALAGPAYTPPDKVVKAPVYISQSAAIAQSQNPSASGWGGHGGYRYHGWRGPYLYSSMYGAQGNVNEEDAQPPVRTQFVAVPYPVPVAAPKPPVPRAPLPTALYSSDGQPLAIPAGARVSTGSVYQYKQGGVNVYTDTPPANGANATRLFGYTEADVPPPGKH